MTPVPLSLDPLSACADPDQLFLQLGIEPFCLPGLLTPALRLSPHATWRALFDSTRFQAFFTPSLPHPQGYGPVLDECLIGRAIVDHFLGDMGGSREPMVRVLRRQWLYHYSHVQLVEVIGTLIKGRYPEAAPGTVEMLNYLLLRQSLPELLVQGVPEHLQYGRSLQSVALIHGAALLEAIRPGAVPVTSFDELIKVSAALAQSTDVGVHALWARTLAIAAQHYAIAHELIPSPNDDIAQVSAADTVHALTCLTAHQDAHAAQLNTLLASRPPDRKHLARQLLTEAGVDHRLWNLAIRVNKWPVLQEHGFSIAPSYSLDRLLAVGRPQALLQDLVMMGEAYIDGKPTIPQAYASAFEVYCQALLGAGAALISRLLSEMPPEHRQLLLSSTCELNRVQFAEGAGSHGLFIRCQAGDHRSDFDQHGVAEEHFFEVFPAAGVARKVPQRFKYRVDADEGLSGNIVESVLRRQAHADKVALARVTPLLPFDSDAYLQGAVSRMGGVLHDPRPGTLLAANELFYRPEATEQAGFAALAKAAAEHLLSPLVAQSQVEHQHLAPWEQIWAKERDWADTAARWVIPFYGCVTDLAAGHRSVGVIAGCVVDAAFALIPLGQFVGATARIVMHAGEMSVLSLTRLTGAAMGRLAAGLAQQSGVFVVRDTGRLGWLAGRAARSTLLREVPRLRAVFAAADVEPLLRFAPPAPRLQRVASVCRVRRDLLPVDCATGIKLITAPPVLPQEGEALLPGHFYSHAMNARMFELAALPVGEDPSLPSLHVFVHENRLRTWQADSGETVEVARADYSRHGLPQELVYLESVMGECVDDPLFGLDPQATGLDSRQFNHESPVVRLGRIVQGVNDVRTLRGIRLEQQGQHWVYLEPDNNVFYRARMTAGQTQNLQLDRVIAGDAGLDEYLMLSEQYREVREIPSIWQDRRNIACMLFDMLDETERDLLPDPAMTYEQYDQYCKASHWQNQFLEHASKVLAGKSYQDLYIAMARETVPDFKIIGERSPDEIAPIVDVLNTLLPTQPPRKGWVELTASTIVQPATINKIRNQTHGANLAFASVHVSGRQSHVYFAVSGGKLGDGVRLKIDLGFTSDSYVKGVYYCDARPRAGAFQGADNSTLAADPRFTTLPAVRHADRLAPRQIDRSLDSERLIGTLLKDELEHEPVTRIDFFTLLDACRSCGGFALPRLRRDFPQADFSVTYLKPYKDD